MTRSTWPWRGEGFDPLEHEIITAEEHGRAAAERLFLQHSLGGGQIANAVHAHGDRILDEMDDALRRAWDGAGREDMDICRVRHFASAALCKRMRELASATGLGRA